LIPVELQVTNLCQYKKYNLKYKPGITGIVGNNGKGKSNLLDAAQFFAITGLTPPKYTKSELLRWKSNSGHTVFKFLHNNINYRLSRNIHDSKTVLSWKDSKGNSQSIKKLAEVNDEMEKILGMNFTIFRETCFVGQGYLSNIVDMAHSPRMAYFQKISNVAKAETIRSSLQGYLNKMVVYPDRTADIAELRDIVDQSKIRHSSNLLAIKELEIELDRFNEILPMAKDAIKGTTEKEYKTKIKDIDRKIDAVEKEMKGLQNKIRRLKISEVTPLTEEEIKLKQKLIEKESIEKALKKEQIDLAKHMTTKPEVSEDEEKLTTDLKEVKDQLRVLNLKTKASEDGTCPVCESNYNTPTSAFSKDLDFWATALREMEGRREHFDTSSKLLSKWSYIKEDFNRRCGDLLQRSREITPKGGKAFTREELNTREEALSSYLDKLKQKQEINLKVNKKRVALTTYKTEKVMAEKETFFPEALRKSAEIQIDTHQKYEDRVAAKLLEQQELLTRVEECEKQILKYMTEQTLADNIKKVEALFERSKEVLHRENLPKLAMRRMLLALNTKLAFYLEQFQTVFTAQINDQFDFICDFVSSNDNKKSARALSGGQKVALALAFRFALTDVLSSSVPILILDEPTVHLDEENIQCVRNVILEVRRHTEKGMYVLIATHEPILYSAFSRVIDVGV